MKKIGEAMKSHPVTDERLRLRDDLEAQLKTKEELARRLREELAVKEAYLLGMLEGNHALAPTADLLESLVS